MADFHPLPSRTDGRSAAWRALDEAAEKLARATPSAEMPSMDHASMKDFDKVYEPSDDTYLLIDGIKADFAKNAYTYEANMKTILEIGCGSGAPIVYLAKLVPNSTAIATDINLVALGFCQKTATENSVKNIQTIQTDLATALLLADHREGIDAIIFNPPYVPTPNDEVAGNGIEASWAGGERGRRVIDRALPQIAELLAVPHGICYMITIDDNEPEELAKVCETLGLLMKPLVRRRAHNEYLSVQKISRKHTR